MRLLELLRSWGERARPVSVADVLAEAHRSRFSGQLVLHFQNGIPQKVEGGRPVTVDLYTSDLTHTGSPTTLNSSTSLRA